MSKNILFISEQKLKDTSFLSDNVDPKHLLPTVKAVQDMYILPLLGTGLYNKLQELVSTAPVPVGVYKTLLDDYLTDVLVWYVLANMPMVLQYKLLNKGVMLRNGEYMQTSTFQEVQSMKDDCLVKAKFYAQRAIEYLCAHNTDYPEYINPGSTSDTVHPDTTQYDCGIYLGNHIVDSRSAEEKYQGNNYRKPY
ncbi:hypothetical protein FHW36_10680 [Chitinophaga polysaccharea]|uniref:Uncharacterized protein n=2 Tax=Chitinophaga polysaccharea TaxID=1293035 RepID=A0A561PL69_9BACT|nr:hypothetical protein FHW36_10680 [Chitinophaga polysaccharea]